jgi:acyl-CoA synthetase (AMP-forming)/AMP-acid ligase II
MTEARIDLIHELLFPAVRTVPDRPAIVEPDGTATTFADFYAQVGALADWVAARTQRGDRVAVIADNGAWYARLYYAVPRNGRVLTLINQRLRPDEQMAQLAATEPTVLVGDSKYLSALAPLPSTSHVISFEDPEWQRGQGVSPSTDDEQAAPDDPAWLLFTSGSTGTPKPVVHTHRSMTTAVRGTVAGRSVRSGGVYLLPFPMCHIAGYNMLVHHVAQSTVLPVPVFRPDLFAHAVNTHGVTSCSLAPTMLHSLLAHIDESGTTLPTLREVAYGSAAIPADLLRRAIATLDVDFHQGYGMTETGGNVTFLGPEEHRAGARGDAAALASAGRPHSEVELRITEGSGEILLRGAQVAPGLAPEVGEGWFATGDVGRIDAEGRLVVVDRLKDVIITGGENVASREVEDVLSSHPDVDVVAVVGVPDEYWGEAICAVVVARHGHHPTVDALTAHVRAQLAAFKRPRHVLFVDALPMTSNGKIAKPEVRKLVRDHLG